MKRVMWVECKDDQVVGAARIGWVEIKEKGKKLIYKKQSFRTLRGQGFKTNYFDLETREEYWISGCRKDGRNALYSTEVNIDDDALEEYWVNIRNQPQNRKTKRFMACGKYPR